MISFSGIHTKGPPGSQISLGKVSLFLNCTILCGWWSWWLEDFSNFNPCVHIPFSKKGKQGERTLKSTSQRLNITTSAFVPLFRTADTWLLRGRLGNEVLISGGYVTSRKSRLMERMPFWGQLNTSAIPPSSKHFSMRLVVWTQLVLILKNNSKWWTILSLLSKIS